MSESSVEQHIDAVDAYARTLFLRTRQNPDLHDVTDAVRQIHVALRHLRVEAADPDSLLASHDSIYSRQLRPLVDSCANTLGRLEDALEEHDEGKGHDDGRDGDAAGLRTARIRLRGEKASLDGFLDAVQLQKSKAAATVNTDEGTLERIQDKVDEVANRVSSRRDSGFEDDEDHVWKEFKAELEKEGFSPVVLRKHRDVLRAYIRSLETMSSQTGAPPSVRGMLEYEAEAHKTARHASDKEMDHRAAAGRFMLSPELIPQTRAPGGQPPPIPPKEPLPELESPPTLQPRRPSSPEDIDDTESIDSMALILTRDIMDMDQMGSSMANMHLHPDLRQQHALASSPDPKYLSWHATEAADLSGSSPQQQQAWLSRSAQPNGQPSLHGQQNPRTALAPDRYGKEIPMNAQWTRINRDLVSPEVLARAGVRYEARPTFVAVLGRLSREEIADFARQSADCRAARTVRQNNPPLPPRGGGDGARHTHQRTDSKSSREDADDDESDLFDESDLTDSDDDGTSEKGTKSYPFIVSPPDKTSPSATAKPKSILKNRNENHVRFDPEPYEVSPSKSPSSSSYRSDDRPGSERRGRRGDDDRDHRGSSHRNHGHHHRSGSEGDKHRPRLTYDDRDDRDDRDHHHHRRHRSDRERDRDRGRDRERERKSSKKMGWGETLGAVGLGGAAVSLLSVLAEAAT